MNNKYVIPSITWILRNASMFERYREEKRRAPIFFPSPSVIWLPPNDRGHSCILLGPPTATHSYQRMDLHPRTPKLRATEANDDVPPLKLDDGAVEYNTEDHVVDDRELRKTHELS